ncbi:NADPH-dependent FMN reductase [Nocardiopsis chromatogenes]|uniref:NADPH-dependent FMN reductase n=1 Tax=Nocardiopsis chromatogenes TaxID=280239 RepID=UPI00034B6869|nr:NAD(P)H-dependent oxidoreductase [Nocardiopsis chromatogenes]
MTDNDRLRIAVIIGSTRVGRFGPVPARWIAAHARGRGDLDVDMVDLADAALPTVMGGDDEGEPLPEPVAALGARLAAADAFIVVTPVYNRGYPASLKNAVDWYFDEWSAKPVGFVSYGGAGGGLQAVEQLRNVFNEVHAHTVRSAVAFSDFPDKFDGQGRPTDAEGADAAAKELLDQLSWWALALKEARERRPFTV